MILGIYILLCIIKIATFKWGWLLLAFLLTALLE